ncbi:hypothetical protein XaFJ1_GM001865 [Xanthomonas albilineans]|nr:hypothetical protein XaFJ1_GM001865 [Xanthomonas albilineans]
MPMNAFHQPVIRIWQRAVGRKANGAFGIQKFSQTRVLSDLEAPTQCVWAKTIDGHRHQLLTFQAKQGCGIARQESPKPLEKTTIPLGIWQVLGEVAQKRQ